MSIIVNLLYGFTMLSICVPSHAPAMLKSSRPSSHMQKIEPKLEFWHNDQKIAEIPSSVANKLSTVFNAQLHGPLKRNKFKINFSDGDEFNFNPKAVTLFTRMVNAPTTLANPLAISTLSALQVKTPAELQKMLIHADRDLVIDLYHFLTTYDINEFVPLLAEYFPCELALTNDLYNHPIFPFFENQQFRILIQTICSLPAYSMILVQQPLVIQHIDSVNTAVLSLNGKYVVTASDDRTAKIYDITAQKVIRTIPHNDIVNSAVFSLNGKYVVTASHDRTAKVYNIADQKVIGIIAHTGAVGSAVFSLNSKYVVTASWDNTAKIYDITAQKVIGTIAHTNWVNSAVFSLNGKYVVTASYDGTAKIYDITAQKVIRTIHYDEPVNSATCSLNGKYVATASYDKTAQIYDMKTKQVIGTIQHGYNVNSAVFSPDGKYVATASWDKTAKIYDIATKLVIGAIHHDNWVISAVFSPDDKYVVTASCDKTAKIYDITAQKVIHTIHHDQLVNSATCSPDGRYIITASNDNTARLTPLTLCGMPDMQVITIATLIEIAKQMAAAEEVEPLVKTGWLYKEFKKLSDGEQQRLYSQFPHIKQLIDTAKK